MIHYYSTAAYIRLSREDGDKAESDSIINQKEMLRIYMENHEELILKDFYVDDGYSGTNFVRPGFQRMMQDVEGGRVDCILVKDLSRFGRDYIQTGKYIKYIFPGLGIRFIAVCDNYDSQNSGFIEDALLMPIMNLVNDAYCRDISNKVRWQQEARRKQGIYIGAFAVYGYIKSDKERGKLIVDEYAADIVRWIFNMRLCGNSAEKIAGKLDAMEVPSPLAYKKINNSRFTTTFARSENPGWTPVAIRRILSNEIYTGVLIQGKDRKTSYKLPDRKKLPREEWIRAEGAVEPLVSREIFDKVQKMDLRKGIK